MGTCQGHCYATGFRVERQQCDVDDYEARGNECTYGREWCRCKEDAEYEWAEFSLYFLVVTTATERIWTYHARSETTHGPGPPVKV